MKRLYAFPLRVYVVVLLLAAAGVFAGLQLPVSLFPNSTKPEVRASFRFGLLSADDFLEQYGRHLESRLRRIRTDAATVRSVGAAYDTGGVELTIGFGWGDDPDAATREVESAVAAASARMPEAVRRTLRIYNGSDNGGVIDVSFYSDKRPLDEVYELVEPLIMPRVRSVPDAQSPDLYLPGRREILLELDADAMASLGLLPRDIEAAVTAALAKHGGGEVVVGARALSVRVESYPSDATTVAPLTGITVPTSRGTAVPLAQVARIDLVPQTLGARSFRTDGMPSLILEATPKPGGNVKRMAEDIIRIVEDAAKQLPPDIKYRAIIDPSQFIRAATRNVMNEVIIGALLAVVVLFLFIGRLRNVIMAAIEIPLSILLAFILMRLTGVNLNLVSLAGLAVSAGMNVDASVVVMENIIRRFELDGGAARTQGQRLRLLLSAVREVRLTVVASTLTSIVVFLPLLFTSALSYALLGDLAKAVVFSHGLSAVVALVLVPTVRLHLMRRETGEHTEPPLGRGLRLLERGYAGALDLLLRRRVLRWSAYAAVITAMAGAAVFLTPGLRRELVGAPDSDFILVVVRTEGNTLLQQMETMSAETESRITEELGERVTGTFVSNWQNRAVIFVRLADRSDMRDAWKTLEGTFANTPRVRYVVRPWNPSELPIPDPPQLRLSVHGGTAVERADVARDISDLLMAEGAYPRVSTQASIRMERELRIVPRTDRLTRLAAAGVPVDARDLADVALVSTRGRVIDSLPVRGRRADIVMRYAPPPGANQELDGATALASHPLGVADRVIPFAALAELNVEEQAPSRYRRDEEDVVLVEAYLDLEEREDAAERLDKAHGIIARWQAARSNVTGPAVIVEEPDQELTEAVHQLGYAALASIVLVLAILLIQMGNLIEALLVLVAIPLGALGAVVSLRLFDSPLSLNSLLGIILLNGIAVANSLILVDFVKRGVASGQSAREAATGAARARLRPILITTLTTVLGMLPVALGHGEGGRILQPLGIAVAGGLWVSTLLTLFLVPALHAGYLQLKGVKA